jgi:hypothetical protein
MSISEVGVFMSLVLGEAAFRREGLLACPALVCAMGFYQFWALAFWYMALSAVLGFVVFLTFGTPVVDAPVLVHQFQMLGPLLAITNFNSTLS